MSASIFRGIPEPQMTLLRDNLALLEHSDPGARQAQMSTNSYAVLHNGRAILFDSNNAGLVPLVRQLAERGFKPAALVLSHRHVAGTGDAIDALVKEFKIPVMMHPIDAQHPQSRGARVAFEDPMGHPLLAEFGLEAVLFPGHTAGHIALYGAGDGGTLLTGDAAMGPTAPQSAAGMERLIRPPAQLSVDDNQLRQHWMAFKRPLSSVLPYHGTGYVDRGSDIAGIVATLTREQPTMGLS